MQLYDFGPLWPRQHAERWILGYALAFVAAYWLNVGIRDFFQVIPDFIYLMYLPAFVRVVAVATAGLAGALGVGLGHLITQWVFKDQAMSVTLLSVGMSMLAAIVALLIVRKMHPNTEINACPQCLLALALLICLLNVGSRALVWQLTGDATPAPSLASLAYLLMGNLGGVLVGYLVLRFALLAWKSRASW
jgi:hypothetical protein